VSKSALAGEHGEYEMVLTNPPFGKESSVTIDWNLREGARAKIRF
jgi:16S rRNA G1207 methylase RsmC